MVAVVSAVIRVVRARLLLVSPQTSTITPPSFSHAFLVLVLKIVFDNTDTGIFQLWHAACGPGRLVVKRCLLIWLREQHLQQQQQRQPSRPEPQAVGSPAPSKQHG